MRAILQHGIRDLRLTELPDPTPSPGEVLLRTKAVTVCASDIHLYAEGDVGGVSWERPFIPGHEMSAVVEEANNTSLAKGTPVVVDPAIPSAWDGYEVQRVFRGATYRIRVRNPAAVCHGVKSLTAGSKAVGGNALPVSPPGSTVEVEAVLG